MGNAARGFSAKRRIVLPLLLLLLLLHYYLELATASNNSTNKKEKRENKEKKEVNKEETDALLKFLGNTKQKSEVNWSPDRPTCEWLGVGCDESGKQVITLNLPGKSFIGSIPNNSIGNLTKLTRLSLGFNSFTGNIPSDFNNLDMLRSLNLNNNFFSGEFPTEIIKLKNLEVLDISVNRFHGNIISLDFSNLIRLRFLDLSNNSFSGQFPTTIFQLKRLEMLYISNNRFSGKIPCGLQYLPRIKHLRLENNNFTGKLPGLHILKSVILSVAYNKLEGAVPDTLSHLGMEAFVGNSLCDRPLSSCDMTGRSYISLRAYCPQQPSLPNPRMATFAMSGGGSLFLLLFLIILLCPIRRRQRSPSTTTFQNTQSTTPADSDELNNQLVIFPENNNIPLWAKGLEVVGVMSEEYEEMESSPSPVKGNSIWTSYNVKLALTDKVVVVKKLLDTYAVFFDKQDFVEKMNFLEKIESHPNVMPLRGYCIYNELTYLLIYDYFPAGSLYHRLHESKSESVLKWDSRKRIALGAARGLTHLHTVVKVVHGNIKSSNILLLYSSTQEEENNPVDSRVADFGLTPTPPTSYYDCYDDPPGPATRLMAAMDSFESDVYAFGVLLLELLTGMSPAARGDQNLPKWVESIIILSPSNYDKIWDSETTSSNIGEEEKKMVESEMGRLLQIAKQCTHQEANERPKMDKVARMIHEDLNVKRRADDQVVDQDVIHEADNSLGTPPPPPFFTP